MNKKDMKKKIIVLIGIVLGIVICIIVWPNIKCGIQGKKFYQNRNARDARMEGGFCYTPSGHAGQSCHTHKDCGIGWCEANDLKDVNDDCLNKGTCEGTCQDVVIGTYLGLSSPEYYKKDDPYGLNRAAMSDVLMYNP